MFSSQSFSSASVTGRQGYQGIRRVSRTKCVPVKIVCGADVSAATPFLSFTEYLPVSAYALKGSAYALTSNSGMRLGVRWAFLAHPDRRIFMDSSGIPNGGEGRNRTESSPTASLNTLICEAILTLLLQGFKQFLKLSANYPT